MGLAERSRHAAVRTKSAASAASSCLAYSGHLMRSQWAQTLGHVQVRDLRPTARYKNGPFGQPLVRCVAWSTRGGSPAL